MSEKYFIGQKASSFSTQQEFLPISKVILNRDDNTFYVAGNDTGRSIEATNPWATQEMANNILSKLKGFIYKPYRAENVILPIKAEPGDYVTISGVYSMIADAAINYNALCTAGISAPEDEDLNHEYPFVSFQQKDANRQNKKLYSLITKTDSEIRLFVEDQINDISSSFSVEIGQITARVNSAEESIQITIDTIDGFTVTDSSGTTKVKGSSIETDSLYVNAANISGTLTIGQLPSNIATDSDIPTRTSQLTNDSGYQNASGVTTIVNGTVTTDYVEALGITVNAANISGRLTIGQLPTTVAETSDIPTYTSQLINNSGYQTASGVTSIINGTVTTDYVNALDIYAATLRGDQIKLLQGSGPISGVISLSAATSAAYAVDITSYAALRITASSGYIFLDNGYSTFWLNPGSDLKGIMSQNVMPNSGDTWYVGDYNRRYSGVYVTNGLITSSDRNLKHSIQAMPDKYVNLLYSLEPSIFQMDAGTSGRFHAGFIAQDVEREMAANSISDLEFAGLVIGGMDTENPVYMLRYEEFIPIAIKAIQSINERLKKLEAQK